MNLPYQYTSLARIIDPRIRTNLLILIITTLSGVIAGALNLALTSNFGDAIARGFWTGAAVMIAWVITREADPDHENAALAVAVFTAVLALWSTSTLRLTPLVALIVAARIVNRIVGPPAKITDSAVLLGISLFAALTGDAVAATIALFAYLLDAGLLQPQQWQLGFAAAGLGVLLLAWNQPRLVYSGVDGVQWLIIVVCVAAYFLVAMTTERCVTPCDVVGYRLDVGRVRAAMLLVVLTGVAGVAWYGGVALYALLPVWTTMIGIAAYRVYLRVMPG
ncbi:MAG: hypothetical protein H7Y11_06670 [Armatimonadetes bacterium]|nr:hypothetical protein [Anaerolineae bacterium]